MSQDLLKEGVTTTGRTSAGSCHGACLQGTAQTDLISIRTWELDPLKLLFYSLRGQKHFLTGGQC